ncbi:MAG: alpha/beta hydrolase [Acidobacteria bacterium]|nr:alpha/beta hydrolase [Acidobacteriota bacterium]
MSVLGPSRARTWSVVGTLFLVGAGAASAAAQDWRTYVTVQHPERFTINWHAFYEKASELTDAARQALPHSLDLAYGTDPKQRLDLYFPLETPRQAPVFLFIHGGGFRDGDRRQYGYVAVPLAARGVITAVMSYRLLPHVYPSQVTDVELALAWLVTNIGRHGGDPRRIYVGGHSAGAILSALLGVRTDWQGARGLPSDVIKGIVPVSGPYDLRGLSGFVADFIPADGPDRVRASPILRIARTPPAVVAYGEKEEPYASGSRSFVDALVAHGGRATLTALQGMGHDQTALTLADAASPLTQAVLMLVKPTP